MLFRCFFYEHMCRAMPLPWLAFIAALLPHSLALREGRTKLPNPRAPPTPSDADRGGGWERVRRDCRAEGSLEATAQSKR